MICHLVMQASLTRYHKRMSLDITPQVAPGRRLIQSYGDQQFRLAGESMPGSILVFQDKVVQWDVDNAQDIAIDSLQVMLSVADAFDIIIIGCGSEFVPPPKNLRSELKQHGLVLEWMDTGAACRTYNVLLVEDRQVAAALIAVP